MPAMAIWLLAACKKDDQTRVQIYPEGPKADVQFLDGAPSPSQGRPGAIVTFKVKGLTPGIPYYFVVTTVDTPGIESDPMLSTEVTATPR